MKKVAGGCVDPRHHRKGWWGRGVALTGAMVLGSQWAGGTVPEVSEPDAKATATAIEELTEIMVEAPEPRYVSPTRRDQIGRIWAPVMINGHGPFRLVLDGRDEIVTDLTLAAFGNTRSYGGGMLICPDADHTDGQLDITMVHSASRTRLIRLFPTVYKGTHVNLDQVTTARATSVDVESPGINAYADGDYACGLPAEISAVRGALQILRSPNRLPG